MDQKIVRDHEADGCERSDFPMITYESSLGNSPYMRMTRGGRDNESSFGRMRPNDTMLMHERTTQYSKTNQAHICSFYNRGECTRGAQCPYGHEMLRTGEKERNNTKDRYGSGRQACEIDTLESPEDKLNLGELNSRIQQLDIRDKFDGVMNMISFLCSCFCDSCLEDL